MDELTKCATEWRKPPSKKVKTVSISGKGVFWGFWVRGRTTSRYFTCVHVAHPFSPKLKVVAMLRQHRRASNQIFPRNTAVSKIEKCKACFKLYSKSWQSGDIRRSFGLLNTPAVVGVSYSEFPFHWTFSVALPKLSTSQYLCCCIQTWSVLNLSPY